MQAERIIEKAKQLGINISSGNSLECLEEIALQLGIDNFNPNTDSSLLENTLDSKLAQSSSPSLEDTPSDLGENIPQTKGRFGEAEYNAARGEDGKYDKNYYTNKGKELDDKVEKAKENKNNLQKEVVDKTQGGTNKFQNKNAFDKAKDNINLLKAKNERLQNKISGAKAKAYQAMHPVESLKSQAKSAVSKVVKDTGKKIGVAVKKAFVTFLTSNPIALVIIACVLLLLLIILLFFSGEGSNSSGNTVGYFNNSCNYNETTVTLTKCDKSLSEVLSLKDYVIGMTYSYIKDESYSDETIKSLMIILKTNALSNGNYTSSKKSIVIDDCDMAYTLTSSIDNTNLNALEKLYSIIEEEIFVSTSYTSTITSLSPRNSLKLNQEILKEIERLSDSLKYSDILLKIYNNNSSNDTATTEYRETIFVGDSRMTDMKNYGIVNDENSVYGNEMGYNWLVGSVSSSYDESSYNCKSNAINCVNQKIGNDPADIVSWLGINDIVNMEKYYQKYYELASGEWSHHNIYIVSVGYVDDSKSTYVKNSDIDNFNNYMKEQINNSGLSNLNYIELGFTKEETIAGSEDGIHYYKEFSQKIYDKILEFVGDSTEINDTKDIYRLSKYCTYYTLTENDAYWWPIGSENPTQGNNIYGGEPTSTTVTSPYGMRLHPVYNEYRNHSGIDIGAGSQEVVIATKDGTIESVSNTCVADGDGCNGGAGNLVVIDHGDGIKSRYLHLYPNSIVVETGEKVKQGQKIGGVGTTGTSTGNHLHFEIIINGSTINPLDYVSAESPRPTSTYTLGYVDDSASTPAENKTEICKSLLESGYSKNAVAGILVNMQVEGGFKTNNLEDCYEENMCCERTNGSKYGFCVHTEIKGFGSDELYTAGVDSGAYSREKFINDHAGFGLIQWTYSTRKEGLYDYAKSKNKSIAALSVQLNWLLEEVEGYTVTKKYLTGNYSAYDIATNFCLDFENPSNKEINCPARANKFTSKMLDFVNNGCSD